jgi:amidase
MTDATDLTDFSVRALLAELKAGSTSSVEICRAFLDRIDQADAVNAVVFTDPEHVLQEAAAADQSRAQGDEAPLLGIPFSVKDSLAVANWPWRSGSFAREYVIAERDATVVSRLRESGAIPLCKTATPEYTWSAQTHSELHGRTRNPYDLDRSPGGSSGGEAALHAMHGAPFGLGTDGFTSIRVPAHFCGSSGLRPTAGVVSEAGTWPATKQTGMGDISTTGPMGRYAEDLDLLLSIIAGPDVEDPFVHPLAPADAPVDLRQVKVGVLPSLPGCTQGTTTAIATAVEALLADGATVVDLEPWSTEEAVELAFALMAPDGGVRARRNLEPAGGRHTEEFAELLRSLEQGRMDIDEYLRTLDKLVVYRSKIRRSVAAVDVALVPVAAGPAPLHDRLPGDDLAEYDVNGFAHGFAIALAGLPSAVVPVVMEGPVPVGVQMVGSAHQDFRILEFASAVQRARQEAIPPPTAWMG